MKTKTAISFLGIIFCLIIFQTISQDHHAHSSSSGAPAGYSGDPKGGNKTCTSCHGGSAAIQVSDWISSDIPSSGYVPGTTYTITVIASENGLNTFGFQATAQNSSGVVLGTLLNKSNETKIINTGNYITHTPSGLSGTDSKTWTFDWTAPSSGAGSVTFYAAFNAANGAGNSSGDKIYFSTMQLQEDVSVGVAQVFNEQMSLKLFPNPVRESFNITFFLDKPSLVKITLFDAAGKYHENLFEGIKPKGEFSDKFQISSVLAPGIYFLRVEAENKSSFHRVVIV
jgi:hypothetical protein